MTVDPEAFLARVSPFREDGCLPWLGSFSDGRATVWDGAAGRPVPAAQVAWEIEHGVPWPKAPSIVCLHVCDRGWCVAPEHLAAGSQRANLQDMSHKNRSAVGGGPGSGRGGKSRLPGGRQDPVALQAEATAIREKHLRKIANAPVVLALFE